MELSVCLSVCLSVTRVDQSKTVEVRIMQFLPYSSPILSPVGYSWSLENEVYLISNTQIFDILIFSLPYWI